MRGHERSWTGYRGTVETTEPTSAEARETAWRAHLSRSALVVMDMQRAYFENDALEAHRDQLVTQCGAAVGWARDNGLPVINVRTEHRRDRSTWTLNMLEDDQGFLFEGDPHTQVVDGLDLTGAVDVVKTRDDAFLGTSLSDVITELDVDMLVLTGVSTHTCIATTAAHAFADQLEVVLVRDAIASHRPELHELTLDTLRAEYRCPVVETDQLLRMVVSPAGPARPR